MVKSVAERPAGILCPQCNSNRMSVTKTLPLPGCIIRYRKCRDCGEQFPTRETRAAKRSSHS